MFADGREPKPALAVVAGVEAGRGVEGFKNNRPQTLVRLTEDGGKRFLEYVQELEQVVADAMAAAVALTGPPANV